MVTTTYSGALQPKKKAELLEIALALDISEKGIKEEIQLASRNVSTTPIHTLETILHSRACLAGRNKPPAATSMDLKMTMRLPKLIAFDLDYTLWDFWVDTHIEPPLHQDPKTGVVYDNSTGYYGREGPSTVEFYGDVPGILKNLRDAGVTIAACSRTSAIKLAMEALKLIRIPNGTEASTENSTNTPTENNGDVSQSWTTTTSPAVKFFDQLEIYPTDKTVHFKELHKKTGLPYSEMLFFDDERRNRNVEKLGVTFILVPEGRGVDNKLFKDGLREWRKRHPEPTPSASDA